MNVSLTVARMFPERDASFVLQVTGIFIHLTVPVEKKYSILPYSQMFWVSSS